MKSLKSKLIIPMMALMMTPLFYQNTKAQESKEEDQWNVWIGTCGIYPNDSDLKDAFGSYFGVQLEAQKRLSKDFHLAVGGIYGYGRAEGDDYVINSHLTEMVALGLYKNGRFEIGAGPKISRLNLVAKDSNERDSESYTGIGWEGRMKFKIIDKEKVDLSAMAAYSKVKQDDPTAWPNLGTSRFGLLIEF